jgi:Fic family protein
MSQPTIDFNEIADGVTAVLNARAHEAQLAQREADRTATMRAQQESELAARAQHVAICAEFTRLSALEHSLKTEIETKRATLGTITRELPVLGAQHNALLSELQKMRQRYTFLKG